MVLLDVRVGYCSMLGINDEYSEETRIALKVQEYRNDEQCTKHCRWTCIRAE